MNLLEKQYPKSPGGGGGGIEHFKTVNQWLDGVIDDQGKEVSIHCKQEKNGNQTIEVFRKTKHQKKTNRGTYRTHRIVIQRNEIGGVSDVLLSFFKRQFSGGEPDWVTVRGGAEKVPQWVLSCVRGKIVDFDCDLSLGKGGSEAEEDPSRWWDR